MKNIIKAPYDVRQVEQFTRKIVDLLNDCQDLYGRGAMLDVVANAAASACVAGKVTTTEFKEALDALIAHSEMVS